MDGDLIVIKNRTFQIKVSDVLQVHFLVGITINIES